MSEVMLEPSLPFAKNHLKFGLFLEPDVSILLQPHLPQEVTWVVGT